MLKMLKKVGFNKKLKRRRWLYSLIFVGSELKSTEPENLNVRLPRLSFGFVRTTMTTNDNNDRI